MKSVLQYKSCSFTSITYLYVDVFLSIAFIPRRKLAKWIQRHGFGTRKLVILQWLFLSNILIMGYKSTLLSTLIPIRYEDSNDSLDDVHRSGLPLLIPNGTVIHKFLLGDTRRTVQQIYNRSIVYPYEGGNVMDWYTKM